MKNGRIRTAALAFVLSGMLFTIGAKGFGSLPDPQVMAKKQTEWMKKDLSLSDEQSTKVEGINLKYAKKMDALHQDKEKELQGVLSKEQFDKYKAKKEQRMNEHMNYKKEEMNKAK
jgi:Spy/CpxP family protein refolding chaperone